MKNKIINFLGFVVCWTLAYYFGSVLGYAYDNEMNRMDIIPVLCGLGGMYYFYKAIMSEDV